MVRVTGSIPVPPTILFTPNHGSPTNPKSTDDFGRLRHSFDLCWPAETNFETKRRFAVAGISEAQKFGPRYDAWDETCVQA